MSTSIEQIISERGASACGAKQCSISRARHGGLAFGSGPQDMGGYWQRPCEICARAFEQTHPAEGACWPFEGIEYTEGNHG